MIILGPHVAQLKTQKISISHKHKSIHSNASYNVPCITKVDQSFSQPLSHKVISKVSTRDYNIFAGWAAGEARILVIKWFLLDPNHSNAVATGDIITFKHWLRCWIFYEENVIYSIYLTSIRFMFGLFSCSFNLKRKNFPNVFLS